LGSRNVIGHVTIVFPIGYFLLVVFMEPSVLSLMVSEIQWRTWLDAMVQRHVTLNDL